MTSNGTSLHRTGAQPLAMFISSAFTLLGLAMASDARAGKEARFSVRAS